MAQLSVSPMTGGSNIRIDVSADSPFANVIYQDVYLYYKVAGISGSTSVVYLGAYMESRVKIFCDYGYTPPELVQTIFNPESKLRLNIPGIGDRYIFNFTEQTDVNGELIEYYVEPNNMGSNGPYGPGFQGGFDDSGERHYYCCYATYRYWLGNNLEVVLSATETTKIFADWSYVTHITSVPPIRDSAYVYLSFNNLPYIESYPTEIKDEQTSFAIRYSVPEPEELDYLQFGLLDNTNNVLGGYQLASNTSDVHYFRLSSDILDAIYERYQTETIVNLFLGVRSKNLDEDTILRTYPVVFEIVPMPPTLTWTMADTDPQTVAATGVNIVMVRHQSDISITIDPIAYKNSYITESYIALGNNKVYNSKTALFTNAQNNVFNIYAKDSRGHTTLKDISLTMVDYFPVTCNLSVDTPTTADKMKVHISGRYWDGNFGVSDNFIKFEYKYTSNVEGHSRDWTLATGIPAITLSNGNYHISFDIDVPNHVDTYTVQVRARDLFNEATSREVTVKSIPVFDWGENDFNFNVPVSVKDNLNVSGTIYQGGSPIADFIVQAGTNGIWTYRLWDSGVAECWGTVAPAAHSITNAWGALYTKDNAIPQQNYPFQFTADPVVSMTLHNPTGNCWAFTGTPGGVSKSPAFGLARGTSGSVTVGARIMAIGRWK